MSVDTGITCRDCGAIWNEKDAQCPACGSIHRYVSVSGKAVVVSTSVAYAHSIVYSKSAVKTINKLDKPTNEMVEQLPDQEKVLVFELVRRLVPDDVATPKDIKAIHAAQEEYRRGETIPHDSVNWN